MTIFDMRAFINMAMLLSDNDIAHGLRQLMLNIVIDIINNKNNYYYDELSWLPENNYRRQFLKH